MARKTRTTLTLNGGNGIIITQDGVGYNGSVTNSTRGVITINDAPNYTNALEFITIATTGDAQDFGDADPSGSAAGKGMGDYPACMSDSHGGVA